VNALQASLLVCLVLASGGCHCCQDEANALLLGVPLAGAIVGWLRAKVHHLRHHKDCSKGKNNVV
jgi:hypothetical protein